MRLQAWIVSVLSLLLITQPHAGAQPVPQQAVIEHFTNTFCSICAGRNPGFYSNLHSFPDVLHISYYPSSPYPACPFSQMNKTAQDARAQYYGVYGGTPRLVLNGLAVPAAASYNDPELFRSVRGALSEYSVRISQRGLSDEKAEVTIVIKKVSPDTVSLPGLYVVVTEDTVVFSARNGENIHYNKFAAAISGIDPTPLPAIAAVGDSLVRTYVIDRSGQQPNRHITAMLQDGAGKALQSARVPVMEKPMSVVGTPVAELPVLYPNPASSFLFFPTLSAGYHQYTIANTTGQIVQQGLVYDPSVSVSIEKLAGGFYMVSVQENGTMRRATFVKY